ncbi:hypothetical protein [Bordetella avium]|uniref:hypothetical protein n=1 Tax=Bordetella avium TaxID=521 RepID=UPI000579F251|nr:hypothetical protein [Bordetella avium]
MDHGILNLPLAKRGNIDAQIDRYKRDMRAEKAREAKEQRIQREADRVTAKALVEALSAVELARWAERLRCNKLQAKKKLLSEAHWLPQSVIKALQH